MPSQPSLPTKCPSCGEAMQVQRLRCTGCGTEVQGSYRPCRICALDLEARELFDLFLDTRGNLKEVQRRLGVSYPTARQRIDELFQKLEAPPVGPTPAEVLAKVRKGELSVEQAEALLRGKR
ncbi:MAG: DUF2089 domain-containing protein [Myxococcales bacterium]